jgi:hypothetical protein
VRTKTRAVGKSMRGLFPQKKNPIIKAHLPTRELMGKMLFSRIGLTNPDHLITKFRFREKSNR